MRLNMKKISLLLCLIVLPSCSTPQSQFIEGTSAEIAAEARKQKELVLQNRYEGNKRVQRISYPILASNADLCGDKVGPAYGMGIWNTYSIDSTYRDAAKNKYGVTKQPELFIAVKGSPAAKAGLKEGDKILAINDITIAPNRHAIRKMTDAVADNKYQAADFSIRRGEKEISVPVTPVKACNTTAAVIWGKQEVNAYADGKSIAIHEGMMKFAKDDNELALAIAHELAHNGMGHVESQTKNALGAGLLGFALEVAVISAGGYADGSITNNMMAVGQRAYSQDFEKEADYVGMYMLARAGFPTEGAANFWRRMAAENDAGAITTGGTHPTSPERFIAIEKTHDEIQSQVAANKELLPNIKPKSEQRLKVDDGGSFENLN